MTRENVAIRPALTRRAPALIRLSNPLTRKLLKIGMPMGPNVLMTVRGRSSGEPRSAAVGIVEIAGRRFVIGAYGPVQWVHNLRAAGEADIRVHGETVRVRGTELDRESALAFYRDTLPGYIAHFPWLGRLFAKALFGSVAPEILNNPERAAVVRPVFELQLVDQGQASVPR